MPKRNILDFLSRKKRKIGPKPEPKYKWNSSTKPTYVKNLPPKLPSSKLPQKLPQKLPPKLPPKLPSKLPSKPKPKPLPSPSPSPKPPNTIAQVKVVGRCSHIRDIKRWIETKMKNPKSSNLLLTGPPGSGKTLVLEKIVQTLQLEAETIPMCDLEESMNNGLDMVIFSSAPRKILIIDAIFAYESKIIRIVNLVKRIYGDFKTKTKKSIPLVFIGSDEYNRYLPILKRMCKHIRFNSYSDASLMSICKRAGYKNPGRSIYLAKGDARRMLLSMQLQLSTPHTSHKRPQRISNVFQAVKKASPSNVIEFENTFGSMFSSLVLQHTKVDDLDTIADCLSDGDILRNSVSGLSSYVTLAPLLPIGEFRYKKTTKHKNRNILGTLLVDYKHVHDISCDTAAIDQIYLSRLIQNDLTEEHMFSSTRTPIFDETSGRKKSQRLTKVLREIDRQYKK